MNEYCYYKGIEDNTHIRCSNIIYDAHFENKYEMDSVMNFYSKERNTDHIWHPIIYKKIEGGICTSSENDMYDIRFENIDEVDSTLNFEFKEDKKPIIKQRWSRRFYNHIEEYTCNYFENIIYDAYFEDKNEIDSLMNFHFKERNMDRYWHPYVYKEIENYICNDVAKNRNYMFLKNNRCYK